MLRELFVSSKFIRCPWMKQDMSREYSYRMLLILLSFLVFFAMAEIITQLVVKDDAFWEYDEALGVKLVENKIGWWCKSEFCNKVQINSQGFNDDEFKESDRTILFFGDS